MKDIFYFGSSLKTSLAQAFCNAGHTVIHLSSAQGRHEFLSGAPTCGAAIVEWHSTRDQSIVARAKSLHIPILVITTRLVSALKADPPSADLYLEDPAPDHEVVTTVLDMMAAIQPAPRARAAAACASSSGEAKKRPQGARTAK